MNLLIKVVLCGILTLILDLILPADRKDIKAVLGVVACCIMATSVMTYIEPVAALIEQVKSVSKLNSEMIEILWKAVGIGVLTEIAGFVCKDFGNSTLEKMMQLMGSAAILWLTLRLFQEFMNLIEDVLERM